MENKIYKTNFARNHLKLRKNCMKHLLKFLTLLIIFSSCKQKIEDSDFKKLNGYWEIEKVVLPNSDDKDYKINETIDYFEINKNEGFRHKVTPQFNGKYLVNEFAEKVTIIRKDDKVLLDYKTEFAKWQDELISISDDKLVVKNDANIEYHYKKPTPFSVK